MLINVGGNRTWGEGYVRSGVIYQEVVANREDFYGMV